MGSRCLSPGPAFSPDGTEIVFSQLDPQAANRDLRLMDPNGTIRQLTRVPQTFVGLR